MLHTHPAGAGSTLKGKRKKKADTNDGQRAKTAQGGGGTDGPPKPTYTAKRTWPKQSTHLNPHDTLRRGTRGELGTKWGTSWWKTKGTKTISLNTELSSWIPRSRALCPSGPVFKSATRALNGCTSSHELGAQYVSPHVTVKAEAAVKNEVSGSSERLHSDRQAFRRGSLGPQEQRDNPKMLKNRKASCFTLLKRITRLKCVNSEVKSVDIHPKQGCLDWPYGTLPESP